MGVRQGGRAQNQWAASAFNFAAGFKGAPRGAFDYTRWGKFKTRDGPKALLGLQPPAVTPGARSKQAALARVYRLFKEARERGDIPWEWIVDETRSVERVSTWSNPTAYARCVARSYRRDFWDQQPVRVEVWSEKGTVRGVLQPVLDKYAVGFRVMHGFSSATALHDVAEDDGRELVVLYVGDFDPSGLYMSERDLPERIAGYGGDHITLKRIALTQKQVTNLPSFPATDKCKDTRYGWFRASNYGSLCRELDAMDPNDLRRCVEDAIMDLIEPEAWERCEVVNQAEQESLRTVLEKWGAP
jgi:hypothetical protein